MTPEKGDFDAVALFDAMDRKRESAGMRWNQVVKEITAMSRALDDKFAKAGITPHPIGASTVINMKKRKDTTCQHAAAMLRWLGASPEAFVPGAAKREKPLRPAGNDRKLRWSLPVLARDLDEARKEGGLTWQQVAEEVPCTVNQLTGLKKVRYGISMVLAMRIVRWLDRPAADFIAAAEW